MRLIDADKLNIYDVSPAYGTCVMGITEEDIELAPTVEAIPIYWIEEWCLSQDLEYIRIAIKKMMDNWKAERKEE